jgi:hypothetical protein
MYRALVRIREAPIVESANLNPVQLASRQRERRHIYSPADEGVEVYGGWLSERLAPEPVIASSISPTRVSQRRRRPSPNLQAGGHLAKFESLK